jgi:hypothetical protein
VGGYDARIAHAFATLGYDAFPFEAFDDAGRPKVPDGVSVPAHYTDTIGRIAVAPVWSEIFAAVSQLDDRGWSSYMAALAFVGNDVRVAIFKSFGSVGGAAEGDEWSRSYQGTISQTISDYAGRSHLVDPAWVSVINETIGGLPPSQTANDPAGKTPGGGTATLESLDAPVDALQVEGVAPIFLLGLRLLASVLTNVTVRTYVRTTVFWYTAKGMGDIDRSGASAWTPLHKLYSDRSKRTVHGIWNASGPKPERPAFWYGNEYPWRGPGIPDMPHEPWQWCRAFYPTAQCGGPEFAQGEGPPCVGESAADDMS